MPVDYDAPLSITLEHGQKRVKRGLLSAICSGKTWGRSFYSDTWVDPELKAGMLRPYQIAPEYSTTGTGNYVRLAKANYSLTSPTKWVDHDRGRCTGDVYLHALDVNEAVITSSTYEANRAFFISYYAYNVGNDDFLQLECGWGSSASHGKSAMSVKVYSNGRIECFRNGVYIGEATLRRRADDTDDATRLMWDKGGAQVAQETVDLLLLPMARRSLLVYCPTTQGSAVFTVEDIADDDTTTVLIPSGLKFWWYVPSGQATVQVSPCRFPASGYLTAQRTVFPLPVPADATFEFFTFVDPAYPGTDGASVAASMVEVNSPTTAFVPDGEKTECRIKIAFSSGIGTHTPFVYGAHGFVMPEIVETPGADLDLISYVLEASLSVPESHTDVAFSLKLKEPEAVEGLSGGEKLRRIQNRPIRVSIDGIDLIDGRLNVKNWEEAISDEARELDAEARDAWQTLERGLVPGDIPLDSLSLEEAWTYLLRFAGVDVESIEIDAVDFTLPTNGNTAEGDFAVMMKVGDTYGQWVSDLRDTYAGTWSIGFVPTATGIKFRAVDPSQEPDDADVVLYSRIEDARAFWIAEGESEAEANRLAPYRVFRSYKEQPQFPEANEIRVTGYDWRLRKALHAVKRDESALDPEAEIAERPDNWTGELLPYAWVDSRITSVAAAERCCELLYNRLTQKMPLAEFEAEFVRKPDGAPLWKGDLVRLDGIGLFRVVALTANFEKEPTKTDNWRWRTTKYVVEMKEREEASE